MDGWLAGFMAEERLPESFRLTFEEVCRPLADRASDWRRDFGRTALVGLCGTAIGFLFAFVQTRLDVPFKRVLHIIALVPIVSPPRRRCTVR